MGEGVGVGRMEKMGPGQERAVSSGRSSARSSRVSRGPKEPPIVQHGGAAGVLTWGRPVKDCCHGSQRCKDPGFNLLGPQSGWPPCSPCQPASLSSVPQKQRKQMMLRHRERR
jgi:hypothetical protein